MRTALLACLALLGLLSGCATLGNRAETVHVSLAALRPREVRVLEQVYEVEVRVQNLGDQALVLDGLSFTLEINGQSFARGAANQSVTVDRLSSAVVPAEVVTPTFNLLRQVLQARQEGFTRLEYALEGRLFTVAPRGKIRFADHGRLEHPAAVPPGSPAGDSFTATSLAPAAP